MRISYDPEVDALYIRFMTGTIEVTTHQLSEDPFVPTIGETGVAGNLDSKGRRSKGRRWDRQRW